MSVAIGTRLGVYEILAAIGAGGMGEVYRARDTKLNRDVAIKVLLTAVTNDPDRLARFSREAQVLASLNHPNIAHIHGLEDSGGVTALVMELVEGPTLADVIAGRNGSQTGQSWQTTAPGGMSEARQAATALSPSERNARVSAAGSGAPAAGKKVGPRGIEIKEALAIATQIAEALEAAHEQGIVHRDLKPANIKVRPDGTVKVLDFGLAKAMEAGAGGTGGAGGFVSQSPTITSPAAMTAVGVILGTAAYMAPEQARGKPVDKRADIWAFGCVVFEMLAGGRPFDGENVTDVVAAIVRADPAWSALPAATPEPIRQLLRRCLEKDPRVRLRDIGEARIAIERVLDGRDDDRPSTVAGVRPRPWWIRAVPWAIAAAALIVAARSLVQLRVAPSSPPVVTRNRIDIKDFGGFVNVSRDGTRVAYTIWGGPQRFALAVRAFDEFESKRIPGGDNAGFPVFSPNGRWILYSTASEPDKIKKIPADGGSSFTLCDGSLDRGAAWGDDGTVVFSGADGLRRVSDEGGAPQPLTKVDRAKGETSHVRPQFLPGGRTLLFTIVTSRAAPQFAALDIATGTSRIVANGGDNGRYVPTGHLTFVRAATLFAVPFDVERLIVTGAEAPVVEAVSTAGPEGTGDYSVSDNGLLVYSEGFDVGTALAWIDRGGNVEAVPGTERYRWDVGRLSPDGLHIAAATINDDGGHDVWMVDARRGTPTRLTFGDGGGNPIWTPDGRSVVYSSNRPAADGTFGIYRVAADGSGKPELLFAARERVDASAFTPDGQILLITQRGGAASISDIRVLALNAVAGAREPRLLHDVRGRESSAQISPDGRWVAYQSAESGTMEIYVESFPGPGGKVRLSTQGGIEPRWSRSGRQLFYMDRVPPPRRLMEVDIQAGRVVSAGTPREVSPPDSKRILDALDGQRFLAGVPRTGAATGSMFAIVTNWFEELRRRAPAKR